VGILLHAGHVILQLSNLRVIRLILCFQVSQLLQLSINFLLGISLDNVHLVCHLIDFLLEHGLNALFPCQHILTQFDFLLNVGSQIGNHVVQRSNLITL